jgi:hypothetical protein
VYRNPVRPILLALALVGCQTLPTTTESTHAVPSGTYTITQSGSNGNVRTYQLRVVSADPWQLTFQWLTYPAGGQQRAFWADRFLAHDGYHTELESWDLYFTTTWCTFVGNYLDDHPGSCTITQP